MSPQAGRSRPPPCSAPDTAVAVRQAGKRFGTEWVVQDVSFAAAPGTILGLFGPSGSGKTTILRLLLGVLHADSGDVCVLGTTPQRFRASTRARIGYLPQLFVLYPELAVQQNLAVVASLYGLGWLRRRGPIRRVLELVQLWEHRHKPAALLSGGMKRRLGLAAALVHDPDLLVMDEPTAGIDPLLRARLWEQFRNLRDAGRTLVVTSQYVTEADSCDQVVLLGQGRLVAVGTPSAVRAQALGGEIVEIVAAPLDTPVVVALAGLALVRRVQSLAANRLRLTVDRASLAIPQVLDLLRRHQVAVRQVEERRPSFDEVFVRLMGRNDDRLPG